MHMSTHVSRQILSHLQLSLVHVLSRHIFVSCIIITLVRSVKPCDRVHAWLPWSTCTTLPQAEPNDAAHAPHGEEDSWQKLQSRRRASGQKFLGDKLSNFHLLTSLALCQGTSRVSHLLFKFCNNDKADIETVASARQQKRLRRRQKGPDHWSAVDHSDEVHFQQVKDQAQKCLQHLWAEILGPLRLLVCADAMFPTEQGFSSHSKLDYLVESVLRTCAGLRWRLLDKFQLPPWSLAEVALPTCSPGAVPWQSPYLIHNAHQHVRFCFVVLDSKR